MNTLLGFAFAQIVVLIYAFGAARLIAYAEDKFIPIEFFTAHPRREP